MSELSRQEMAFLATAEGGSSADTINNLPADLYNPNSMAITIKKAKIKDNLFLEAEYSEQVQDGTNLVKKDCTAPVHDDMHGHLAR